MVNPLGKNNPCQFDNYVRHIDIRNSKSTSSEVAERRNDESGYVYVNLSGMILENIVNTETVELPVA